ncbi:hypothetical protein LY78DRAFT_199166 [Colletotrichum sublineola]|nr:hypothetical protein LY78DRAFT_199166 [Colletotrichum sublineola]
MSDFRLVIARRGCNFRIIDFRGACISPAHSCTICLGCWRQFCESARLRCTPMFHCFFGGAPFSTTWFIGIHMPKDAENGAGMHSYPQRHNSTSAFELRLLCSRPRPKHEWQARSSATQRRYGSRSDQKLLDADRTKFSFKNQQP